MAPTETLSAPSRPPGGSPPAPPPSTLRWRSDHPLRSSPQPRPSPTLNHRREPHTPTASRPNQDVSGHRFAQDGSFRAAAIDYSPIANLKHSTLLSRLASSTFGNLTAGKPAALFHGLHGLPTSTAPASQQAGAPFNFGSGVTRPRTPRDNPNIPRPACLAADLESAHSETSH